MSAPKICPSCRAPVPLSAEQCPRCLMRLGIDLPTGGAAVEAESSAPRARVRAAPLSIETVAARFPDLDVEALVGQGGMGVVYRARQKNLGRMVALKVLHPDVSSDPAFADRFLREARALARLAHPNIVAVYDFGERDGTYFLLMEYVDGASLRDLIRTKDLAPRQALSIVREICDALQFAHDEGVVHRDIKPENVLLDKKGRVKIADFGLAKLVGAAAADLTLTAPGQVMGTVHYMAPEQMERPRDVDHRADIYSLGVVFYEMLTGSLPLGRFEPPSHRVQLDVRLDEIVLRSLEREPSRRYQHAVEVKTDVAGVEAGPAAPPRTRDSIVGKIETLDGDPQDADDKPEFVFGIRSSIDPSRGVWSLVWFLPVWVLAGWLVNVGAIGLAAGMAILFALTCWVLKAWTLRTPELARALDLESALRKTMRVAGAFVLFAFGFAAIFLAHVSWWERGTRDYEPPAGATYLSRTEEPTIEAYREVAGSETTPGTLQTTRMDRLDADDLTFAVPTAVHAGWGLFMWTLAALCLVGKRRVPRRAMWTPIGSTIGCALLGVALANALLVWTRPAQPQSFLQVAVRADVSNRPNLQSAARAFLVSRGYQTHVDWSGLTPQDDPSARHWSVSLAHVPDAIERWRLSWSGALRKTPHWRVTLSPTTDPNVVRVDAHLGAIPSRQDPRWREWHDLAEALVRRLQRP
ncbi:MAG: serine/threonine-protein kinase [Planctomycetota bacterium]